MWIFSSIISLSHAAYLGHNNLAITPSMGWNHWNSYGLAINSSLIIQNARTLKRLSLDNYRYIIIDDGWQAEQRDANGKLAPDPIRFPNMRRLVADIHSLGFKAGIYSDAGLYTCGGYPGSLDFEQVDALTFAEWGFDYLKYDNCYAGGRLGTPETSYNRFKKMSDALLSVKHINPIIHSLSNWGDDRTWYSNLIKVLGSLDFK